MNNRQSILLDIINEFPEHIHHKYCVKILSNELPKYKQLITDIQNRALNNYLKLINNHTNNLDPLNYSKSTIKKINILKPLIIKIIKKYDLPDNHTNDSSDDSSYDSSYDDDSGEDTISTHDVIKTCSVSMKNNFDFSVYLSHNGLEIQLVQPKTNRVFRTYLNDLKFFHNETLAKTVHDINEIYMILSHLTLFPENIVEISFSKNIAEMCCIDGEYDYDLKLHLI